jgi:hypothetical protein
MLSPLFSILFAYLNYKIRRYSDDEQSEEHTVTDEDRKA